ncbi:hypothetical protein V6N13_087711 [Hibiscus sabdariffa]|uniref:Uncharacterized protein n=1 Tax=Hibiscus sabdariffa TaxID=183260 RepID=A0ABR2FX31_9ROSI
MLNPSSTQQKIKGKRALLTSLHLERSKLSGSPDVQFNFSSGKYDGKFATPFGKGGKGDKVSNGGKAHVAKESQALELRVEPGFYLP